MYYLSLHHDLKCSSESFAATCALALSSAVCHLHPTDSQTRQDLADQLMTPSNTSQDAWRAKAGFRAACAQGQGLLASSLIGLGRSSAPDRNLMSLIIKQLLQQLCTVWPDAAPKVKLLDESWPDGLQLGAEELCLEDDDHIYLLGVMTGQQQKFNVIMCNVTFISMLSCLDQTS